jgi:hypothetical protein
MSRYLEEIERLCEKAKNGEIKSLSELFDDVAIVREMRLQCSTSNEEEVWRAEQKEGEFRYWAAKLVREQALLEEEI